MKIVLLFGHCWINPAFFDVSVSICNKSIVQVYVLSAFDIYLKLINCILVRVFRSFRRYYCLRFVLKSVIFVVCLTIILVEPAKDDDDDEDEILIDTLSHYLRGIINLGLILLIFFGRIDWWGSCSIDWLIDWLITNKWLIDFMIDNCWCSVINLCDTCFSPVFTLIVC